MTTAGIFRRGLIAMALVGFAFILPTPGRAEPAHGQDFAALQADVQKSFREKVTPFLKTYCTDCHGDKKRKGSVTFSPTLPSRSQS